ncbi:conserved hypothetical protein [delta proteobacterium NaphS2]|nr:conserved hypothetical protein [delta proteobacterium NaphS2]
MTAAFVFSFVFPFLFLVALIQWAMERFGKNVSGWISLPSIALASGALVLLPIGGLPVGRWFIAFFPNPSLPLTIFLFSRIVKHSFQIELLDSKAIHTCRLFSLLAGVTLYPMALGAGPFDPYSAGWHFSWLFVLLLVITLGLLLFKNRFSIVLLATILAYDLHLLESSNFWDYLIDPVLVFISIGAIISQMAKRGFNALASRQP